MNDQRPTKILPAMIFLMASMWTVSGCQTSANHVIASTGTVIGVELSQNPANQNPQAKLGYYRSELAIVPTNRGNCERKPDGTFECADPQGAGGAKDTTDVLLELRYGGIFDLGKSSGIYQRLAVGSTAVSRPGASLMFAKNSEGEVTLEAEKVMAAVNKVPVPDPKVTAEKAVVVRKFLEKKSAQEDVSPFEAAATALGYPKSSRKFNDYPAFRDFSVDAGTTIDDVRAIRAALESQGIVF